MKDSSMRAWTNVGPAEEREALLHGIRESMLKLLSPHVAPDVALRAIKISPVLRR